MFRKGVEIATLDPFHGCKNAINDQLEDAVAVLDAFQVVKLATAAVDEVRRRVQQDIHGHRGRRDDPLYLHPHRVPPTSELHRKTYSPQQLWRSTSRIFTWHCAQHQRSAYHQARRADGRRVAEEILSSFPTCPIPEIARLGGTLDQWRDAFLGYFTTGGANDGGTEAINGLIELARRRQRIPRPDNYRPRMVLLCGGLRL
ncbi:ISL3 family transposase [Tessaracoccus sp. Y36]